VFVFQWVWMVPGELGHQLDNVVSHVVRVTLSR